MESTPWANPRHPSHQDRFPPGPSRVSSYQTPAGQRRMVDVTAPHGSASTIEANSNPPSSHNVNGRMGESESPVLQLKRAPTEHAAYTDTPGSHARNLGILGRETYPTMSSPAQHNEGSEEQIAQRWGPRPHNAIPGPTISGPNPGRPDVARVPFAQRNGTVSVGSGLFGR